MATLDVAFKRQKDMFALGRELASSRIAAFATAHGYDTDGPNRIGDTETFLEWCERLGRDGLEVDGKPFDLHKRPALRCIYEAIPSTREGFYLQRFAIMKGAQTGLTVMTFLLVCYMVLKFNPMKSGVYYPDRSLAAYMSASRFLPTVRTIKPAYTALLGASNNGEGNVLTRRIGKSEVIFLWTSGGTATESFPLDMIVADEVQNMLTSDIEVIMERMSASEIRFFFACSTAKWQGADIDALFRAGTMQRFHTRCQCDGGIILDDRFPECITFNDGRWPDAPQDYVYHCPTCGTYINDAQDGEFVAENPEARTQSWHFPQTLSPTVSPREIIEAFKAAKDLQNFYNRKLGKPWNDPNQIPITLAICERQAEIGVAAGVVWKDRGKGTYMGIDQMGSFNVALIAERMKDGRMALIHAEFIYDLDPFERCSVLMRQYGVSVCVLEQLPNVNDARRFANKHMGKVFLAGYADMKDDMLMWSDQITDSDRKTAEDATTRYTVTLNQYKTMQAALFRIKDGGAVFPDPAQLQQDVLENGVKRRASLLREVVFVHFTKVALVVEEDGGESAANKKHARAANKRRAKVVKIGIDPHAAYAWMLLNVAWAREQGMGSIFIPSMGVAEHKTMPGHAQGIDVGQLPPAVQAMMEKPHPGTCGGCAAFDNGLCTERGLNVGPKDQSCILYVGLD